jgi:reverse gyrase
MAKKTKLAPEEIQALENIKTKNIAIVEEFGRIGIINLDIEARQERAEDFLAKLRNEEVNLSKSLEEKYGKGTVNLETGEFNSLK